MRSVVSAALFLTCFIGAPGLASAQDPEPPPPPSPPPASRAVPRSEQPRSEQIRVREPEARPQETRETRTREERAPERQPERAPQAVEEGGARRRDPGQANRPAEETNRIRVRESAPAVSTAGENESGAQRRGDVRRPTTESGGNAAIATGHAVPRSAAPVPPRPVYIYPDYYRYYSRYYNRYYDPWGYGLGYLYYAPWIWNNGYYHGSSGYYGSSGQGSYSSGYDLGKLRIKVKPRDAQVFVDGYYAGTVDDFDGNFQALKLAGGGYKIEVRKPGFETLHFDVHVQPDRTITFRGAMQQIP